MKWKTFQGEHSAYGVKSLEDRGRRRDCARAPIIAWKYIIVKTWLGFILHPHGCEKLQRDFKEDLNMMGSFSAKILASRRRTGWRATPRKDCSGRCALATSRSVKTVSALQGEEENKVSHWMVRMPWENKGYSGIFLNVHICVFVLLARTSYLNLL